ncbi:MAG TPA: endopeptidase La [Burkholderiaceae bacterium]|nr:endopeptidase La [Burkholderiaceae bacterium]
MSEEQTRPFDSPLPLLPLRDVVVFPHMVIPLFVGRPKSIKALESAMEGGKSIMLVAQKNASKDEPSAADIHSIGCVSNILQMLKLPDGTVKVLVEGARRARIVEVDDSGAHFVCELAPVEPDTDANPESEALRRAILAQSDQRVKLNKKTPPEILASLNGIDDPGRLADTIAAHLPIRIEQKQDILETSSVSERLEKLLAQIETELDILQVEKRIRGRVKRQMEKSQREYYLNEQVKAIQKELGEGEEGADFEELEKKIKAARMPKEALKKVEAELKKLKLMSPMSAEATVVRNFIDTLIGLPWKKKSKINDDLTNAEKVLDDDHYGLEKVKERILEYLAVQQRVDKLKSPILCLVGPPGVGKTSLGQSIARATNRKFVRMALGGVRDEAEIRGHRRTYIGSMPGKILQNLARVGVRNPLFLLDEVDKLGMDFRGDPASALLEVLDPEQNSTFVDHYVEVEYDLSDVMFVATANTLNIPPPLLDRMEVIRLSGYTEDEKVNIAQRYLLPKQMRNNGLKPEELSVTEAALRDIVRYYTREAGVRSLEREISKICRKVVKTLLLNKQGDKARQERKITVGPKNLDKFLGVRRYSFGIAEKDNQIGQVTGLAWTEVGGELLTIEAVAVPGKGKTTFTGKLGDVMQESIKAAITVVRRRAQRLGVPADFHEKRDLHIHVPEGATPKDGPSAGIAMTTALVSMLTDVPVRADVAMTGEITLRGEVLAIGGLKEKLLAAHRGGIKTVLIPEENVKDLAEIPDNVKNRLEIVPVRWIDRVLEVALERAPRPLPEDDAAGAAVPASDKPAAGDVVTH